MAFIKISNDIEFMLLVNNMYDKTIGDYLLWEIIHKYFVNLKLLFCLPQVFCSNCVASY